MRLSHRTIVPCVAVALATLLPRESIAQRGADSTQVKSVDLVVLIAVDQLRADYLDRFRPQLTRGFARLRGRGVFFPNAIQDHALTETAPGHASMLSGRVPAHTRIWSNSGGVEDPSSPLLDGLALENSSTVRGASPRRFAGTTLVDWLRARDPGVQALGVSRKDRAAILPIGRSQSPTTQAVWYVDGKFTTSTYYADSLPEWVRTWNAKFDLPRVAGQTWTLALPDSAYHEPDDAAWENGGKDRVFPHEPPQQPKGLASRLERVPWMDSVTLDIALAGVHARGLGHRPDAHEPDVLSVSLSTTDAIGHDFGPDSREVHDHLVRLDGWLGAFLDSLAAIVPAQRTMFVLTADHGVSPMPQRLAHEGTRGGRINVTPIAKQLSSQLRARWSMDFGIEFDNGLLAADIDVLAARGVNVDSLARSLAATVSKQAGVKRVYNRQTVAALPNDQDAARWRRSLPRDLGWLIAGVAEEGYVFSDGTKAEHGTMNPESRSVPILFVIPGVAPRTDPRVVRTIDIAPTLAALLGIRPTEPLDGRSLAIR